MIKLKAGLDTTDYRLERARPLDGPHGAEWKTMAKGKFGLLCGALMFVTLCAFTSSAWAQWDPDPPPGDEDGDPVPPPPSEPVDPVPPPPADEEPIYVPSEEESAPSAYVAPASGYGTPVVQPAPWKTSTVLGKNPATAKPADDSTDEDEEEKSVSGEFVFGSYGRAQVTFDPDGNRGLNQNVTGHGPRLFEPSYAELDLSYHIQKDDGFDALVLFTLALFEPLSHYNGFETEQFWAVRNMLAELGGFIPALPGLRLWVGSRMYRGDDIYLLDYWPLDNLNTMGGGLIFSHKGFDARIHVGVNRLNDDYQQQTIRVPGARFGAAEKVMLDRQRLIASGRIGHTFTGLSGDFGLKMLVYGETHHLPGGKRIPPVLVNGAGDTAYPPTEITETVAEDRGFVIGGQVGVFGFGKASHLNLFVRYATGLAAYGEFGVPYGTSNDGTADGAMEVVGGLSGNWESKWVGLMIGAYLRRFRDADVNRFDTDDFGEGALVVRPVVFITDHFHQAFELSYQRHTPYGLDPQTNQQEIAAVTQLTIMEIISLDRGNYQRPQIRLYYTLGLPNAAAQDMYEPGDTRRLSKPEHFFGLGAEWWFNSSSYK